MRIIKNRLMHGNFTTKHPLHTPAESYGAISVEAGGCDGCGVCQALCPTDAITYNTAVGKVDWDRLRCIYCNNCVLACPGHKLKNSHDDLLAMVEPYGGAHITGPGWGVGDNGAGDDIEALGTQLHQLIKKRFGRSMVLRSVDAGSCNACMLELSATMNPYYSLQRFGVDFAASPRHADAIVVTGPVAINMKEALIKTYEAMPAPRMVIGVGTCSHVGGIFEACYGNMAPLHEVVPVDLVVPGCPPSPRAIIHGLLTLMGKDTEKP